LNFLIDNNLPPSLARALNELCKADGHLVIPLKDRFSSNTKDADWITELKTEGGWTVISQDRFLKGNAERQAFRESGLPIFCLARQWATDTYWNKAQNLVKWWPAIISQSELIKGGAAFKVAWRFSPPGKFEQIKM
jgi:hypothetical protein